MESISRAHQNKNGLPLLEKSYLTVLQDSNIASTIMNSIQRINPEEMPHNPAFSQAVVTEGKGKTIYIGGQNAVTRQQAIVGEGDLFVQTEQALHNIHTLLKACNADWNNVVKMTIYIVQGQDVMMGYRAAQKSMTGMTEPPAISVLIVAALGNPAFLVEIEAVAFVPES